MRELYELTWPGKHEAILEAGKPTDRVLRPCVDDSKNFETTQNLYIECDNLDALKILQSLKESRMSPKCPEDSNALTCPTVRACSLTLRIHRQH